MVIQGNYVHRLLTFIFISYQGLYPESHGIIANKMFDPKTKRMFKMSSIESEWWGGEPLWITLEKQNRTSAVFFAPGSETEVSSLAAV